MNDQPDTSYSPEVISSYVWDAIKALDGLADLHRSSLQSLSDKVRLERHGPVRLEQADGRTTLDIHIVVAGDANIPALVAAMRESIVDYLGRMTSLHLDAVTIHVDDIVWEHDGDE
jgi:uncharacterized alkaline shock family protein YloU